MTEQQTEPEQAPAPRRIEYLRLSDLKANPANPKSHDIETIDGSISRFGMIEGITRDDRTGYIVSGHGRTATLTQARDRGDQPPEGIMLDKDGEWLVPVGVGWSSSSDLEAGAALIGLNRTTELGGWVDESLLGLLDDLAAEGDNGFEGIGFNDQDRLQLAELIEQTAGGGYDDEEEDTDRAATTGEMLSIADVGWGEPKHEVHHGDIWHLGNHTLVVLKLHTEWDQWAPLLVPGMVLAPYPEPFLTTGTVALENALLLIQPNPYLAGHLLDKHASTFPDQQPTKVEK